MYHTNSGTTDTILAYRFENSSATATKNVCGDPHYRTAANLHAQTSCQTVQASRDNRDDVEQQQAARRAIKIKHILE